MPVLSVTVPADYEGTERLDKYVSSIPGGMNRSRLKGGASDVRVNGKPRKLSYKVRSGDAIHIVWEDSVPADIVPEDIPLDILYEDADVCVVDKRQGMVTHPAAGNWSGTLVNALLFHWNRAAIENPAEGSPAESLARRRPGIVHRLDKDTSGVIITARHRDAEEWLQAQFRRHRGLVKEYIAICQGRPPQRHGVLRTYIVRDPKNRRRFKAVPDAAGGKYAETAYSCIACYGEYSLLCIRIATGRTHQIRVHLRSLNCPVLGDSLYGRPDKLFPSVTLMLHARLLAITLPGHTERSTFRSPTPERFRAVQHALHRRYKKTILPKEPGRRPPCPQK